MCIFFLPYKKVCQNVWIFRIAMFSVFWKTFKLKPLCTKILQYPSASILTQRPTYNLVPYVFGMYLLAGNRDTWIRNTFYTSRASRLGIHSKKRTTFFFPEESFRFFAAKHIVSDLKWQCHLHSTSCKEHFSISISTLLHH